MKGIIYHVFTFSNAICYEVSLSHKEFGRKIHQRLRNGIIFIRIEKWDKRERGKNKEFEPNNHMVVIMFCAFNLCIQLP